MYTTESETMNIIFETNYAVFSVFASLLITEIMGSVVLLLFWGQASSKVIDYIKPIWEVTGTFGVFWVVTMDFAYPSLLIPIASIFSPLLTVFLILFISRNASIAFAEFIIKRKWLDEVKLYKAYAFSTIILGLTVLVLLSALVSGAGVDLVKGTFSLGTWLSTPSILFVLGTLTIGVGFTPLFFSLTYMKKLTLPLTSVGVGLSILSYYLYSSTFVNALMLIPVILTLIVGILYVVSDKTAAIVSNKAVFITLLSTVIFSLQFLVYPSALGGAIPVDSVTISGPTAHAYLVITTVGGLLLAVMLTFYLHVASRLNTLEKIV